MSGIAGKSVGIDGTGTGIAGRLNVGNPGNSGSGGNSGTSGMFGIANPAGKGTDMDGNSIAGKPGSSGMAGNAGGPGISGTENPPGNGISIAGISGKLQLLIAISPQPHWLNRYLATAFVTAVLVGQTAPWPLRGYER